MQDDIKGIVHQAVRQYMDDTFTTIVDDIHTIRRTVVGAPEEGNPGLIKRMEVTERRVAILIWLLPVWVTVGTGFGQVLVSWWF